MPPLEISRLIDETTARAQGLDHELGIWHQVDPYLTASMCRYCGRLAWVIRQDQGYLVGGEVLQVNCGAS